MQYKKHDALHTAPPLMPWQLSLDGVDLTQSSRFSNPSKLSITQYQFNLRYPIKSINKASIYVKFEEKKTKNDIGLRFDTIQLFRKHQIY